MKSFLFQRTGGAPDTLLTYGYFEYCPTPPGAEIESSVEDLPLKTRSILSERSYLVSFVLWHRNTQKRLALGY